MIYVRFSGAGRWGISGVASVVGGDTLDVVIVLRDIENANVRCQTFQTTPETGDS